ncbi:MAG: VCBS repeat-containing protein [Anaerolineae bacterium]|nr:VCBS repeat-containing protein [Anaerolineae bacterium]
MTRRHRPVRGLIWLTAVIGLVLTTHTAGTEALYVRRVITLPSGRVHSETALGDVNGDGIDDIVVGSFDGVVSAYRGNGTMLWSYDTGNAAIEGKAAIGDINRDGRNEVVVGYGSTFTPGAPGGVVALSHDGKLLWRYSSKDFNGDSIPDGVYASPALADVDLNDAGKLEVIYGSFDGYVRVLNHDGTLCWERFTRDTIWSSPAVGDIDHDGRPEIVIGNDSHQEAAFGTIDGGRLLALNAEDGTAVPGFPISVNETVWSSPVLVDLNNDGWLDIVVGTGNCWTNPMCAVPTGNTHPVSKVLYAWDHTGKSLTGWPVALPEYSMASPSSADVDGDGTSEIVINSADGHVLVIRGNGGLMAGWPRLVTTPAGVGTVVHYGTNASPVLADLTGDGQVEIIIPSNWEVVVFDRNGTQLTRDTFPSAKWDLSTEYTIAKTPAVGDIDGDGKVELVSGGARSGGGTGAIYIWDFAITANDLSMPWPFARLNSQNVAAQSVIPEIVTSAPSGISVLQEYGTGDVVTAKLRIASSTLARIDWSLSAPSGVAVSASSGTATLEGVVVTLSIPTRGLTIRSTPYLIGNVTVTASLNGVAVVNSPVSIPVRVLIVDTIQRVFLPLVVD